MGAGPVRADKFIDLAADAAQVLARLGGSHVIFFTDLAHSLPLGGLLQGEVGHQRGGGVKVQDAVGINDQRPVPVGVEPQVDAALLLGVLATIVIHAGLRSVDCRLWIEQPF